MKVKDLASIMEIANDGEVVIHRRGECAFVKCCLSPIEMHEYDDYKVVNITLSGYSGCGATLFVDIE